MAERRASSASDNIHTAQIAAPDKRFDFLIF
jgi:hypothetical protein